MDEDPPRTGAGREQLLVRSRRECACPSKGGHLETAMKVLAGLDALPGSTQGRAEIDERSGELEAGR